MLLIHSDKEGDKSEIVIGNAYTQVYYAPDFFMSHRGIVCVS